MRHRPRSTCRCTVSMLLTSTLGRSLSSPHSPGSAIRLPTKDCLLHGFDQSDFSKSLSPLTVPHKVGMLGGGLYTNSDTSNIYGNTRYTTGGYFEVYNMVSEYLPIIRNSFLPTREQMIIHPCVSHIRPFPHNARVI